MIRLLLTIGLLSTTSLWADELSLIGEARLSGTVRSISSEGVVELASPLSPETLFLKGASVSKVVFSQAAESADLSSEWVTLGNGDTFPGQIDSMDGSTLSLDSPDAGKLKIRRGAIRALQFGVGINRVIGAGIKSLPAWSMEEPAEGWELDGGILTMDGPGVISRKLELPPRFSIGFELGWGEMPAFQMTFADPLKPEDEKSDHYAFQFTSTGIELRRYTADGKPPVTLGFLKRTPQQFPDKNLRVEIRVDRPKGMIALYLNGELEGRFMDVVGTAPSAGGVTFANIGADDSGQELSGLQVLEWNPSFDRYRTKERGDKSRDAVITRQGERWNGELVNIRREPAGAVFVFKSESRTQLIELPEAEVSTIFFAEMEAAPEAGTTPFSIQLQGSGILGIASCAFDETNARVTHPLLGTLSISRQRIASLEWTGKKGAEP